MKPIRLIAVLALGLGVSACATIDTPTRNSSFEQIPGNAVPLDNNFADSGAPVQVPTSVNAAVVASVATGADALAIVPGQSPVSVNTVTVTVPRSLKVSEANRYLPPGDIVWRGDPIGDRYAQVRTIFETAMLQGVEPMNGPVKVDLEIVVKRFHALTEKARYTVGGLHSITFDLAVRNPETGELLLPVRTIRADLDAFGGRQAILADARGDTQKVRITNHLAEVIRQELTNPEGYRNANLGFYQLLNNSI
jgi:uncharacterized protein DUF6778